MEILLGRTQPSYDEFFALKDINISISHGERVGVLGLNGSGKSTLLKTIVGIYPPTTGSIKSCGRIVPLIEVGTGFDMEMSGRANIHLNGALLARSKEEMLALEREIIVFSGLEPFIDMPIKYYSSGMIGRLAFSIGTMIDPEILVIDEIFSSGDAQFVDKAVRRMEQLFDQSHVVLFVSHDSNQIQSLCNRVIVIHNGSVVKDGDPAESIAYYYSEIVGNQGESSNRSELVGGRIPIAELST
ncbi:MAG: ATP-binding cassette domain-containing protein [Candidatus Obscuribacterales bacterium]|nr:ATP-binding cassette domain-containing protein [Candidatus Obscuribacterales bacterium]